MEHMTHDILSTVQWTPTGLQAGDDGLPYATHEGELTIMGVVMKCYCLNIGQRVFDAESMARLFGGVL